jgi:excinuclease ABC subunit A
MNSFLLLKGCRQHNLKNIQLTLPKQHIIVITGVSGSGKSSLAFDTLFAEGQRRYLEYLSPQARSWMKQMPKPNVDLIEGLSPTLAISQGQQRLYARGTIATYTDVYDFLSLLYVHLGEQHSPTTGKRLIRYTRQEMVEKILKEFQPGTRLQLLAPIKRQREAIQETIKRLHQMGFIRLQINGQEWMSEEPLPSLENQPRLEVVVDRLEMKPTIRDRLSLSIDTALDLSQGILKLQEGKEGPIHYFTEIYVCPETSISFAPLEIADFNFNSPRGACPTCQGLGGREIAHPSLPILDLLTPLAAQVDAILDHFPKKMGIQLKSIWNAFYKIQGWEDSTLPKELPPSSLRQILEGSTQELPLMLTLEGKKTSLKIYWKGLISSINEALRDKKTRGHLNALSFVEWQTCPSCQGARLKPETLACLIRGKNIHQLCTLTVCEALQELKSWVFEGKEETIAQEILPPILTRLKFLEQVGLGYLELNRQGKTLSTGETQRILLAAQIGAKLSGLIYILDEPSLGLHRQDIQHLQSIIQELKNLGNTVILVEHERSLIREAQQIIELGPGAGMHGGELIFQGSYQEMLQDSNSLTGAWLSGRLNLPKSPKRPLKQEKITVRHATRHNLHDFSITIPLGCLVGFCGVSGSGKSTLVLNIIGEEVQKTIQQPDYQSTLLVGHENIQRLVLSQNQQERFSSRSIPATFIDIMTPLRQLFAETRLAKARGYSPAHFSLNKRGGRCEACEGLGYHRLSMQLMPDLFVPCDVCQGKRYHYDTLQITWGHFNIADVLNLSIEEAYQIFQSIPQIAPKLLLMKELGLEYLTLGQPFNTLSGGEVQRLRLVADLAFPSPERALYILDEPSAGLHLHDIEKLVKILHRLVDQGHSILMIEHHLEMLRQADWLIELGPGGGPQGGRLIFEGSLNKLLKAKTPTGQVMREDMK